MPAYSFLDVSCSISGPGGMFSLSGQGVADEGITIEPVGDKNTMTTGADGEGMHSLSASTASTVTIRLLKTSPANNQLMTMFNFQTASSSRHGKNTIVVRDAARGDVVALEEVAFKKVPPLTYAKEGGLNEWVFDAVKTYPVLGGESALARLL
jgi:hypothetical protein